MVFFQFDNGITVPFPLEVFCSKTKKQREKKNETEGISRIRRLRRDTGPQHLTTAKCHLFHFMALLLDYAINEHGKGLDG